MKLSLKWPLIALCVSLPLSAEAHRAWLLPSATVLSGDDLWVTVDAAVSNDLFYFEHFPLRLANITAAPGLPEGRGRASQLSITAPDGSAVEPKHGSMGRYRTTFDVQITQKGTYKLAVLGGGAFASYKEAGQTKRWFGAPEDFAKSVPANAEDLRATLSQNRMEVFITSGRPTRDTLKPTGKGLELDPVTHPNDLVAGTASTFRFLLDGEPASDLEIEVVPGGNRYRDKLGDFKVKTDAEGKVSISWPEPGMYWIEAVARDAKTNVPGIKQRRAGYIATLEVLP
jgi:uncharacterized GH25 family protein